MNGTELIVRHSFAPNRLRYCGRSDLSDLVPRFISVSSTELQNRLQTELLSFRGLFSYLSLIARENGLNPFDEKVGEAYWIGNELLSNVSHSSFRQLFAEKFSQDDFLGKELALDLAKKIPMDCVCHHSFHVFFTHFMTQAVPVTIRNLDLCRISWGKVMEADGKNPHQLRVEFEPLEFDAQSKKVFFGKKQEKLIEKPFEDSVLEGDWVSFHWNVYCMKLSEKQKNDLEFFTKKNLNAINLQSRIHFSAGNSALASEKSLSEDWLSKEDVEAWKKL
ncbi:MAG: DUF6390 family protein [Candidatus Micrarchaeota archaeon]